MRMSINQYCCKYFFKTCSCFWTNNSWWVGHIWYDEGSLPCRKEFSSLVEWWDLKPGNLKVDYQSRLLLHVADGWWLPCFADTRKSSSQSDSELTQSPSLFMFIWMFSNILHFYYFNLWNPFSFFAGSFILFFFQMTSEFLWFYISSEEHVNLLMGVMNVNILFFCCFSFSFSSHWIQL